MPVITLDGMYPERAPAFELFGTKTDTLPDLIDRIEAAAENDQVGALGLQVLRTYMGYAQMQELRNEILAFRETGKPVVAVMDMADLRGYYLASAADEITIAPVGGLMTYGMSIDMYFLRNMLDKIGAEVQVINSGKYKNALEPLTHDEMSEGTREQYTAILNDLSGAMLGDIAKSRSMTAEDAEAILFSGPHLAPKALETGLVSDVEYPFDKLTTYADEQDLELKWDWNPKPKAAPQPPNFFTLFSGLGGKANKSKTAKPSVAVVYALGNIVDGYLDESPFGSAEMIASDSFIEMLDDVVEDGAEVIVLRINSGGGSAVASDRIWNKLNNIRESGIPVVVSMGNVAASGGYYIAMGSDRIFVSPSTITGSIGVIAGRIILGETYDKIGVNKQSLSIGQNAWLTNETEFYSDEQTAFVDGLIEATYDDFTSRAAQGRGMTQDEIKAIGGGRVWTGSAAVENGLADELGGLKDAIAYARTTVTDGDGLPLVNYPKDKTFEEILEELMSGAIQAPSMQQQQLLAQFADSGLMSDSIPFTKMLVTAVQLLQDQPNILAVDLTSQHFE